MSMIPNEPVRARRARDNGRGEGPRWGAGPGRLSEEERAKIIARLRWLATFLDDAIEIPGLKARVGWDAIIGLIPGIGDVASMGLSLYIVYEAKRLGTPRHVLAMMVANVAIDAAVGSIPALGDVFDMAFKANRRNLKLMGL